MIEIFGVPFDLGGARRGSRLGPEALRLVGLKSSLEAVVGSGKVVDGSDLDLDLRYDDEENLSGLPYARPIAAAVEKVRNRTEAILENGMLPLMLGGEHSMTAGALSACLEKFGDTLGVLWIDAHADINTPGTSSTQNIHGMPLALLSGMDPEGSEEENSHWRLLRSSVGNVLLDIKKVAWFGLRDVDAGERARVQQGIPITMHHVDRTGIESCWKSIFSHFASQGVKHLYVSFDVDSLDPFLAPGTGTAVRGGLTFREAHLLAELVHESLERSKDSESEIQLVGVDLVEVSPIFDHNNQTATVAADWVASLFGKTILGELR